MCHEKDMIQESRQYNTRMNLANSTHTKIKLRGKVKISATNGTEIRSVELRNTLLVEDLRTNLISVSRITDSGREVIFRKKDAFVMDSDGDIEMIVDRVGNLCYVREPQQCAQATSATSEDSSDVIWHRRLGHLNYKAVHALQSENMVFGMKMKKKSESTLGDVCNRGKLARKPFEDREERCREPLGVIHSDLCGPIRVTSHGGSRYVLTFIDDHSRWCYVYFLKAKCEVFEKFKEYQKSVEKQTGREVKSLQSDDGIVYCNQEFDNYLKAEEIHRRLTVPNTLEQNGIAERKNRTLIEMSRCLIIKSGLSPSMWAEAVATANYIRNRCPKKCLGDKTTCELWHKRKPDLKHIRTFGAKAFVLNKTPGKGKFHDRSNEGRMVEYSENAKAYRIKLNSGKIVIARDVNFDENS